MRHDRAASGMLATLGLAGLLLVCGCGDASPGKPAGGAAADWPGAGACVDASRYVDLNSPTCGLQAAIDAAHAARADGGTVVLPPGQFPLRSSLVLSAGLTIRGSGASTILQCAGGATGTLARDCAVGDSEIELKAVCALRLGDEICLRDAEQNGWNCHKAIVLAVQGRRVRFAPASPRWFRVNQSAGVTHAFPAITADGTNDVTIESLRIVGPAASQPADVPFDFVNDAIHLVKCSRVRVRDVTVTRWPADGIGVQGGSDNQVIGCAVSDCRGHGFHPGTRLKQSVFTGNVARGNGQDGLYFCELVRSCTVSNNVFAENGGNGIGGMGLAWGQWNVCSGNVCDGNGRAGIECWGLNNVVTGNVCVNNSRSAPGKFPGILVINATGALIASNRCGDDQKAATQLTGIAETRESDGNLFQGNVVSGSQKGIERVGPHSVSANNIE